MIGNRNLEEWSGVEKGGEKWRRWGEPENRGED